MPASHDQREHRLLPRVRRLVASRRAARRRPARGAWSTSRARSSHSRSGEAASVATAQNLVRTLGRVRTALVIAVPEAEPLVGPARSRYDLADKTGIPAHITILFPFGDRDDGLDELFARFPPFDFGSRASGAGRPSSGSRRSRATGSSR